jgi:hypothetical protein
MPASSTVGNPMISDRGLVQRQQEVMKQQDLMMLDIEKGVGRLHEQVSFFRRNNTKHSSLAAFVCEFQSHKTIDVK